jgi:hypothetical protein
MYRRGKATLESSRLSVLCPNPVEDMEPGHAVLTDGASGAMRKRGCAETLRSNTEWGGTRIDVAYPAPP